MFSHTVKCPVLGIPADTHPREDWWFTRADEALGVPLPPQHSNHRCQQWPWRKGGTKKYLLSFPSRHDLCVEARRCEAHITIYACVGVRQTEMYEKKRKGQYAGSARVTFPSSAWSLFLGKYTPLDAWWPEACLLAEEPWSPSGIFSDAARKIDCLPVPGGCPQSPCVLY